MSSAWKKWERVVSIDTRGEVGMTNGAEDVPSTKEGGAATVGSTAFDLLGAVEGSGGT
jgi:hypothetical protein